MSFLVTSLSELIVTRGPPYQWEECMGSAQGSITQFLSNLPLAVIPPVLILLKHSILLTPPSLLLGSGSLKACVVYPEGRLLWKESWPDSLPRTCSRFLLHTGEIWCSLRRLSGSPRDVTLTSLCLITLHIVLKTQQAILYLHANSRGTCSTLMSPAPPQIIHQRQYYFSPNSARVSRGSQFKFLCDAMPVSPTCLQSIGLVYFCLLYRSTGRTRWHDFTWANQH